MSKINEQEMKFGFKYKDYYKQIKKDFVNSKGKGIDWNDYCCVPMAASIAELTRGATNPALNGQILHDANMMSAFSGWRANNKKIIKIDEMTKKRTYNQIYSEITINSKDIFEKIGYGTFLEVEVEELKKLDVNIKGILVHIEDDVNENRLELRANVLTTEGMMGLVLHLLEGKTLSNCLLDTLRFTSKKIDKCIKNDKVVDIDALKLRKNFDETDFIYYFNYLIFVTILSFI